MISMISLISSTSAIGHKRTPIPSYLAAKPASTPAAMRRSSERDAVGLRPKACLSRRDLRLEVAPIDTDHLAVALLGFSTDPHAVDIFARRMVDYAVGKAALHGEPHAVGS